MTSAASDWAIGRRVGELPEGWAEVTLEEVVLHALGGAWGEPPEKADAEADWVRVRVIRGTEFRGWERGKGRTAELRAIKRASLDKRRLAAGDLVVEISGGGATQPVGRTLLVDEEALGRADHPLICSNFCRQVRLHREVSPAFVHLVLSHQYLCGAFDEYQTQTTNIRNLNFSKFLSGVILPLPPYAEQERIVAKVRELMAPVDRAREGLARVPEIVRRMRQSVLEAAYSGRLTEDWREAHTPKRSLDEVFAATFEMRRQSHAMVCEEAEAFDRRAPRKPRNLLPTPWEAPEPLPLPEMPEGWRIASLQDLLHRSQYGTSVRAEADMRDGLPMLRMGNIQVGQIDVSDLKYVPARSTDVDSFLLRRGDILFNRTNSAELVGKAAVFDLDLKAVFASYLIRLECDERLVSSRYVCGWINSPWGRFWARTVRTDCVSQSNINAAKLLVMPVPVPPLAEQREIVRRIAELFATADAIEQRLAEAERRVEKLRQTILTRALRGELVISEAELARLDGRGHEPASNLLDRIRAERLSRAGARAGSPEASMRGAGMTEELVSEQILAAIRQTCWGAGALSREELIRRVAFRLGCPRFGPSVRVRLEEHVDTAVARRIVGRQGDLLAGATPTIGRYDYKFLREAACALLDRGVEMEVAELVRRVAAHLGFSQSTPAIRERVEKVLDWAAEDGWFEVRDGRVRRL